LKHLVIFVKAPEAGRVKTRLARDIGNHPAAQLYRLMTADIIRRLTNDTRWANWLAYSPGHFPLSSWPGLSRPSIVGSSSRLQQPTGRRPGAMDGRDKPGHDDLGLRLRTIPQGLGNLGARMNRVFQRLPPGPVVIIGSDCPAMTPGHIAAAFAALGENDAVLGPSEDGGYWLIGLKRIPRVPKIFQNVRWSSPDTLADTLESFPKDWRVGILPTLRDIDTLDDLLAYGAALE
jgi:glycosyltransferase A (GT-A) superfamily protein (DUF2064 family)